MPLPLRLGTSTAGLTRVLPDDLRARMLSNSALAAEDADLMRNTAAACADELAHSEVQSLEVFINQSLLHLGLDHPWLRIADRRGEGYEIWSAHAPFGGIDLASQDEELRNHSLQAVIASARLAAKLGAGTLTLHSGKETPDPRQRPERLTLSASSIAAIADLCAELNMKVAVELLPRRCLGNSVNELLDIVEMADRPNVGVCLDTTHSFPAAELTNVVRALGQKLITVHISDHDDNGEKHWLPLRGVVDWPAFVLSLREIGYTGPFMYELPLRYPTIEEAVAALEDNYATLMNSAR